MNGFLGSVPLLNRTFALGQTVTDPLILAKVNLADSYANAIRAVASVVQVNPDDMAASPEAAKLTFKALMKNPQFHGYVMKLLVLSATIVKAGIRALQMTPDQLANVLVGGHRAVSEVLPAAEIETQLKKYEDEIVNRAPENIRAEVRRLIDGSGITPENLAPNMPEGTTKVAVSEAVEAPKEGLSALEIAALIGIPIAVLAAIGIAVK